MREPVTSLSVFRTIRIEMVKKVHCYCLYILKLISSITISQKTLEQFSLNVFYEAFPSSHGSCCLTTAARTAVQFSVKKIQTIDHAHCTAHIYCAVIFSVYRIFAIAKKLHQKLHSMLQHRRDIFARFGTATSSDCVCSISTEFHHGYELIILALSA